MAGIAVEPLFLQKETIATNLGRINVASDGSADGTTKTAHGTGANVIQRVRAQVATGVTVASLPAWNAAAVNEGYRIDVADLGTDDSRVGVTIPSGTWEFRLRLTPSVLQATAQTILTARVFKRASGGTTTELFRKTMAAVTLGAAAANYSITCDSTSIVASGGTTGTPPAISLGSGETIQVEFYIEAPGVAVLGQTITFTVEGAAGAEARVDMPGLTSILTEPAATNTSVIVPAQREVIAETPTTQTTVASLVALEALAQIDALTTLAALAQAEAIAQTDLLTTLTALAQREVIAEAPATVTTVAVLAALEALAQRDDVTTLAAFIALEAIGETQLATTLALLTANWQRISPGLSGTVYDESGSSPIEDALVLIGRDDTNDHFDVVTSDALGEWAIEADPAFTYWIAGWREGAPEIQDVTVRGLEPEETVVETGT